MTLNNNSAQINIDYLISITIFLFAIIFVFQFTSGLFTPFQSDSDETTLIADRTSTLIVENMMSVGNVAVPNLVNKTKVNEFFTQLDGDYDPTIDAIGLNGTYHSYNLNVSLDNSTAVINSAGRTLPSSGNLGQTKRVVVLMDTDSGTTENAILSVRVW
ncbi:MAG: hypothetical protein JXA98_08595 [Methanosarcinaceae archaeon]|nr:hypothetical protein [Methanosarcinaceae archaeon]